MRQLRIIIVDQSTSDARQLQSMMKINGYNNVEVYNQFESTFLYLRNRLPDLVLLGMSFHVKGDGISLGEKIINELDIPVVFIAESLIDSLVDDALILNPYGYLIKPFQPVLLKITIELAIQRYKERLKNQIHYAKSLPTLRRKVDPDIVFFKVEYKLKKVNLREVIFCKAMQNYVELQFEHDKITVHQTFKLIRSILPQDDFIKVHRSYIVRIDRILEISERELLLKKNGEPITVPVSKSFRDNLRGHLYRII